MLLEGLCNSSKLAFEDDKLELRYMDELQKIEKQVGEIRGIISLCHILEDIEMEEKDI